MKLVNKFFLALVLLGLCVVVAYLCARFIPGSDWPGLGIREKLVSLLFLGIIIGALGGMLFLLGLFGWARVEELRTPNNAPASRHQKDYLSSIGQTWDSDEELTRNEALDLIIQHAKKERRKGPAMSGCLLALVLVGILAVCLPNTEYSWSVEIANPTKDSRPFGAF